MSDKPKVVLKNRLYVPSDLVNDEDLSAYTYELSSYESQDPLTVHTYKKLANNMIGFSRGNMGKIQNIFGERFEIVDERAVVPHGYKLQFTGKLRADQETVWNEWKSHGYGLIKCPPRFGKCVTGDSLISTDRGFITIKSLYDSRFGEISLSVLSHEGPAQASHILYKGISETKKLTTHCGLSIQGTHEHPVLVLDENLDLSWIPLSEVKLDKHYVAVSLNSNFFAKKPLSFNLSVRYASNISSKVNTSNTSHVPNTITPELARLLGYLVSDGCLTRNNIIFSAKDSEVVDDIRSSFLSCFGEEVVSSSVSPAGTITLESKSPYIKEFLQYIGLSLEVSNKKTIPWSVLQSPRDIVIQFLRSYFDGDGFTTSKSVACSTSSHLLATQIQVILFNLGIVSRIVNKKRVSRSTNKENTNYVVLISGANISRFYSEIGFSVNRKSKYSSVKHERTGTDVIPYAGNHIKSFIKKGKFGSYYSPEGKHIKFSFPDKISKHSSREYFPRDVLNDTVLLDKIEGVDPHLGRKLKTLSRLNLFFDKVLSVSDAGSQSVYDLTVPGPHSFTANGIVVHNTVLMINMLCKLRQRALILAHESGLLQQFEDSLRKFTNINELELESGQKLCGQLKEYDDVYPIATFSTWQMYNQPGAIDALKNNRNAFGIVFIDEAHACAAPCFSKIVSNFNPYYRVPVTATDRRKDGFDVVVSDVAGPVVAEGFTEQLPADVTVIWTKHEVKHFGNWNGLCNQLVKDDKRNELIAKQVVADVSAGHSCVVFTDRRAHAKMLEQHIVAENPELSDSIDILIGGSPKTEIRDRARSGQTKIVIASPKIVQLGWDVPLWSSLHNTLPMANEHNWYQRLSRVRTPCSSCPGAGGSSCFKPGTCKKLRPVVRIYADPGHKVVFSCLAVMNRVHKKLNFNVEHIKPERKASISTTRAKKWSEVE